MKERENMANESEQTKIWATEESKRLDDERAQKMKDRGYREFYSWKKGENRFRIITAEPRREIEGKYGKQMIFAATTGKEPIDLAVNVRSPVYRMIVNGLAEGKSEFNILKSGDGKETRYEQLE